MATAIVNVAAPAAGLAFWVGYGLVRGDIPIVFANSVSLTLVCIVLTFKLRGTS